MYAVMNLSGQEYVDEYAQRAKKRTKPDGTAKRGAVTAKADRTAKPETAKADGTAKPGPASPALSPAGEDQAPPAKDPIP